VKWEISPTVPAPRSRAHITITRSGDEIGGGSNSTRFTTLKTAVLVPMASANVQMAVKAKPGLRRRLRRLNVTSFNTRRMVLRRRFARLKKVADRN
jgi:hypothetical protein